MADQTVSLKLEGDAEDLQASVRESGEAMEEMAGTATDSAAEVEAAVSGATSAWDEHSSVINGAAAATAATGAALEGLARSQQDTRAVAGRLANTFEDETTDSIMGMAAEVHNATTDLDELVSMMETGRQQGIDSADDLQDYALFWDMIGDATGESADMLAESSSALRAVGVAAGEEQRTLGAFGFIAERTTGQVGEFLKFIDRTGPELRDLGADIDDAAAILGAMEHELGMSGRTARQEFRTAIRDSDGTLDGLLDTLGVGQEVFADYRAEVDQSSDVMEDNAQAFADSRTFAQDLWAEVEKVGARFSGVTDAASDLAPVLTGAGGAVWGFGQLRGVMRGLPARIAGVSGAMRGLSSFLLGPWGIAIGAATTALVLHGRARREARQRVEELTSAIEADSGELAENTRQTVANRLEKEGALRAAQEFGVGLETVVDAALGNSRAMEELEASYEATRSELMELDATTEGHPAKLMELDGAFQSVADTVGGLSSDVAESEEAARRQAEAVGDSEGVMDGAGRAASDLGDDMSGVTDGFDEATSAIEEYQDSIRAAEDPVFALDRALRGVQDAQDAYNEAVKEHGPRSEEASQASWDLMSALSELERAAIDGDLSFDEFEDRLQMWVDKGRITAEQADQIERRVRGLTGAAEDFSGEYVAEVLADTDAASEDIREVMKLMGELPTEHSIAIQASLHGEGAASAGGTMAARQHGGAVGPELGPVLVGEKGPEVVTFGEQGMVHPADVTAQMLSAIQQQPSDGGGFTYAPTFNTMPSEAEHRAALAHAEVAAARARS